MKVFCGNSKPVGIPYFVCFFLGVVNIIKIPIPVGLVLVPWSRQKQHRKRISFVLTLMRIIIKNYQFIVYITMDLPYLNKLADRDEAQSRKHFWW
jgi:hypothetical protein